MSDICEFIIMANKITTTAMSNDLVRDLVLSKENAELLSSRLRQWNHFKIGTKMTFYR